MTTTLLVDVPTYAKLTGDSGSVANDVEDALTEAQETAEQETYRHLLYGSYSESLRIYEDGKVYPSAQPIAAVTSPVVSDVSIQGAGVFLGYFWPSPVVNYGYWNPPVPPQATVTYTGGYHPVGTADANVVTEIIPVKLQRLIARIAFNALHPATLPGTPAGVTSVSVGGVSFSGKDLRTLDPVTDDIRRALRRWRLPNVLGWQGP